ncbi:bacteriocin immunity protein [Companilactobacillus huachuanensis]|uniref:Bacteriocin immunity protein n=1 Tax=Companilactobacillus huachuanensis TaxID=2559914 RepID=A0ABW1RLT0_9LACO|nr:bacteriocin immunity protein [Companilactobacillus huachuanensis]
MDEKSNNLIKSLGTVYNNKIIKNNADLKKIVEQCARSLMGNNDDKVYFEVIAKLSHNVVNYYQTNREEVPEEIKAIYEQIQKDVPAKSVVGKRLRRQFKDDKLFKIF